MRLDFDLEPDDLLIMASESTVESYHNNNISDLHSHKYGGNDTMDIFSQFADGSLVESIGFGIRGTKFNQKIIHYCFGTLLILIGCCGAIGNGLVLYVFTRFTRHLRSGGSTLILSLATGDFAVSVLHFMPAYASFHETWTFGDIGCEIYAGSVGLSGMASLLTLSCIALDRYSVIIGRPLLWLSAKKTCAGIWFFCILLTFPPLVGWSRYVKEGLETSCSWDYKSRDWNNRSYYIFLLVFGFILPVIVIIVSYVGIIQVICQQSKKMNGVTRNGVIHNKKRPTKSDIRTAQVILTIIVTFLTSWTPYALVSFVGQFGDEQALSPLATALPAIFAKASVVYNPIVYGLSHPYFRSAIRMLKARHFPSSHRYSSPYNDRYHYYPGLATATCSGKRLSERKSHNESVRRQMADQHQHKRHNRQRKGGETFAAGLLRQTLNSHEPQSNYATTRTYEMSGSSQDGTANEIMVNQKGWVVMRRLTPRFDPDRSAGASLAVNGELISDSCDPESTVIHSEPDLVHCDQEAFTSLEIVVCSSNANSASVDFSQPFDAQLHLCALYMAPTS